MNIYTCVELLNIQKLNFSSNISSHFHLINKVEYILYGNCVTCIIYSAFIHAII